MIDVAGETLELLLHEELTKERHAVPPRTLYLVGEASQSKIFISTVLKNLRIKSFSPEEFLSLVKSFHDNLVMVEIKTREHVALRKEKILRDADKDDLVLIGNTVDSRKFFLANHFIPVDQNAYWIIARKTMIKVKEETDFSGLTVCEFLIKLPRDLTKNVNVNYADKIRLLGVSNRIVSKDQIMISYFWQLIGEPGFYNHVCVHFTDDHKNILFQGEHMVCLGHPAAELKMIYYKRNPDYPRAPDCGWEESSPEDRYLRSD